MLQIVFKSEGGDRVAHPIEPGKSLTVGRGADADLRIKNSSISRAHARIWEQGGQCYVKDLGSSNFTFVNNDKISECAIQDGDTVRFGDFPVKIMSTGDDRRASRRSRGGYDEPEADDVRSRRARPSALDSGADDDRRSRRSRPAAEPDPVEDRRRARPSQVDAPAADVRSRRSRPGEVEEPPPRASRRDWDDDASSRRSSRDREASRAPEPVREPVVPHREAPAARRPSVVGVDPAELRAAQERASKLEDAIKDSKSRLDDARRRIEELEGREGRFDSEISEWSDRYNKVRAQLDHAQALLDREKADNREQQATIEAFEREVADLEGQLQQVEASREEDTEQLAELKSKTVQKDRRIDELQRELDLMEFDLRHARDELESIQDSMNHENTETRKLERELALLREVIQEKESIVKELQIEIEEQEREIYDLKMGTGVKDLEKARTEMLEKYFEKNRESEDLRRKLSEMEKKYAGMEQDLADYEERIAEAKDVSQHPDFQRKVREIERLQGDLDEARETIEKIEKKLEVFGPDAKAKLDAELNFLRRKNQALEEKVEDLDAASEERASTGAELTFARKKNEALEAKVGELEEALAAAKRDARASEDRADAAVTSSAGGASSEELDEARRDAEEARAEVARLRRELEDAREAAASGGSPGLDDATGQSSVDRALRIDALGTVDEVVDLFGSWKSNVTLLKSYLDEALAASKEGGSTREPLESINEVLTIIQADANDMRRELASLQSTLSSNES